MQTELKQLLKEVDNEFEPSLSSRLKIDDYVNKIISKSTIVPVYENGILNAFISFYCNDYKNYIAYLSMIVVRKNYRRNGVSKLLMQYAINFLTNSGFKFFRLEVYKQNNAALALYKHFGFNVFEEASNSFFMQKKLV